MARIFKLKKKIVGSRKVGQEPSTIRDPENGNLMVSSTQIRKTTLKYCTENLKNKEASKNVESIINLKNLKNILHKLRMNEDTLKEFEITTKEYDEVLRKFASKDTSTYDFLVRSGDSYKEEIGGFLKRMIKEQTFPTNFRKTTLQMIWKGKGPADILRNSRFLQMK